MRWVKFAGAVSLLFAVVCVCGVSLYGQTAVGEVNGVVTDAQGSVIADATVKLTNEATKIENTSATNGSGGFTFINVQPGHYTLQVEKQGFKKANVPSFEVGVNQTVSHNLKMQVGAVDQTVTVIAEGTLIEPSTTELGTVVSERVVNDLPLNGRNFTQLLTLTPGVTPVSTSQNRNAGCCEGNVGIPGSGFSDGSFHGQQNRSKLYFYDGIINTNIRGPTYIVIPNIDLIQEFKVVGHDAKAEFGGASGGVVNMVSKPGTNSLHGSAFEYVRNNIFDARDSFGDGTCTAARCKPGQIVPSGPTPFHQNQFGVAVTGPIIKNRTFFSAGYDGWRYGKADLALSYVPTAAEIGGDFSNTTSNFNRQIFNPFSSRAVGATFVRDAFRCDAAGNPLPLLPGQKVQFTPGAPPAGSVVCNKIPQALIFVPMQQFFQTYAATPNFVDPQGLNNFVRIRPTLNNSNSYTLRIDHRFRDADNVFFRYTEQRNDTSTPIGELGSTSGGSQGRNYGGGWVHVFRPNIILDLRAGYAGRPGVDAGQQNAHSAGLNPMTQEGFIDVKKYNGLLVSLANWTNGGNNNFGIRGAAPRENPNWSLTPNISWITGQHNIKTGFWYITAKRIQLNTFQTYSFNDEQTRNPSLPAGTTGLSLASALLGLPNTFQAQLPIQHGGPIKFKYASWAAYVQDEWKVAHNLTLTAGVRYDYLNQPRTLDGHLWNALDIANQRYLVGLKTLPPPCSTTGNAPCMPDAFYNNPDPHASSVVAVGKRFFAPPPIKDNWGPRLGLAWQIFPNTVVRGGFGIYFDSLTARSQYAQNDLETFTWPDATAFSGVANSCTNGSTCAFTNGTAIDIISQQSLGFATPLPPYTGITGLPWNGYPNNNGDAPNYRDPYSQEWNLQIQHQITPTMMFSIGYVGSQTRRLPYTGQANAARVASPNVTDPVTTTPFGVTTCGPTGSPTNTAACRAAYTTSIDALRQMPWVTAGISYSRSIGFAHYNAMEVSFQKRMSRGLSTLVSYTWSKSTDVSSGYFNGAENGPGGGSTVQNFYDPNSARGVSSYDIPHFVSWATVYELPFGHGKRWVQSGPLSWIIGNWQANYIFQGRAGQPYNLQITGDVANLRGSAPGAPGTYARPSLIPGVDPFTAGPIAANPDPLCQLTLSQVTTVALPGIPIGTKGKAADRTHSPASWFNPCAFAIPSGAFGNLGRNAFRGPHVVNMDFSMFKTIPLPREGMSIQLRFEGFNVFNIQNWDGPSALTINANATSIASGAGRITSLAQGTTPRQLQFGLRVQF